MDRQVVKRSTGPPRSYLPGDKIGVMLHFGDQDDVSRTEVRSAPGGRNQVDSFRRSSGEDDRFCGGSAQKSGRAGPSILVELCGARAQGVYAAMNVSVILSVIPRDFIDHAVWMLGRCSIVQVNQRKAIDFLV